MKDAKKKGRLRHKEETKRRLSETTRRYFENPAARERPSKAVKKFYKEHPEAVCEMSIRQSNYLAVPSNYERFSAQMRISQSRPEVRARIAEGARRRWSRQEERRKTGERSRQLWAEPVFHKEQSAAIRRGWSKPAARLKASNSALLRCAETKFVPHTAKFCRVCSECGVTYTRGQKILASVTDSCVVRKVVCSRACVASLRGRAQCR